MATVKTPVAKTGSTKAQLVKLLGDLSLKDASVAQLEKANELRVLLVGTPKPRKKRSGKAVVAASSTDESL